MHSESNSGWKVLKNLHNRPTIPRERFEHERICWDPKDVDLCLNKVKPEETLVEA
jgi:hypothetical protein